MDACARFCVAVWLLAALVAPRPVDMARAEDAEAEPTPDAAPLDGDETQADPVPARDPFAADEKPALPSRLDPPADSLPAASAAPPPGSPDDLPVEAQPPLVPAAPPAPRPPTAPDGTTSVMIAPPDDAPRAPPVDPRAPPAPSAPPARLAVDGEPPAMARSVATPAGTAPALLSDLLDPLAGQASAPAYARPLTLLEALQRAGDPSRRLWVVQAYWKTAIAFATVKSCSVAGQRIDMVAPGGDPHDRAVLDVAVAAARADLAEAIALLGTTQQELVDLARLPPTEPPPWPVDRPLATPYQTHFDSIFAQRIATGRVRAIARTLPARHESVEARAIATRAATEVFAMAEADHAKGRRPIEAVVAAHASLVSQEREFLRAARAYNTDIAEYAMAVADLTVPDDVFVAMLIGASGAPRPVVPASFPLERAGTPRPGILP